MYRLLLVPLFLLLSACSAASGPPPAAPSSAALIQSEATVVFVPLEGGFYGLVTPDGRRLDPINLPDAFRRDGLKVRFSARPLPRAAGTHMWGLRVELIDIRPL